MSSDAASRDPHEGPDFPKAYEPEFAESRWYDVWEEAGCFRPELKPGGEPYCIVIPPPNVTGSLHMGHAFEHALIDATIRRKRMQGYAALWLPGTDHAGIATQNVVEKQLAEEGTSRHDLGREEFVGRVWAWKEESGGTILRQMRSMGNSCDWTRERFTMDADLSRAVRAVFVRLYQEGLIYRGERIINWCPRCHTALSDIEVEFEESEGEMVEIVYPWADGSEGGVTVATTRAETMLGDTGVAVHPDDERYADAIGRMVILPLQERQIPIVADAAVDPEFGTGAVKVTPGHDPADFEIGERHGLEIINIFDADAALNENGGAFAGLDRYEARLRVKDALRERGVLVSVDSYTHSVGHCQRCSTQLEPLVSKQWFVKVRPLSDPALAAVLEGRTTFLPGRWVKVYRDWLENIRDWCISRQLWWGHQIPVWYCASCGGETVAEEDPAACASCGSEAIERDPDVLDTWFSSALWPFSTLGWPRETEDLARFYPNAMLHTGFDIIFFWVVRMMQMGIHFMGDVPFHEVFYHGLVRDAKGKKMSKSFGNVIDPLELADKYGADALRYALTRAASPGQDVPLAEEWVEGARHFVNKLWNASRFVWMNLDGMPLAEAASGALLDDVPSRWILSRLGGVIERADAAFDSYNFAEAMREIHAFAWGDFCDWCIELAKPALGDPEQRRAEQAVLATVLTQTLRLLHPCIPFATEELWSRLGGEGLLIAADWASAEGLPRDEAAVEAMESFKEVVTAVRSFKAAHGLPPSVKPAVWINAGEPGATEQLTALADRIETLAGVSSVHLGGEAPAGAAAKLVVSAGEIIIPVEGVLDLEAERQRLGRKIAETESEIERARTKLANEGFVANAPSEVVEKERAKLAGLEEARDVLIAHRDELGG